MVFLDDRKRRILQAIIDDYIDTAEPVGSRTIARKHELGLSSATIRNEMADLEEMGYLAQPHTSAGRVPSDIGYRFYVDQLMRARELTPDEVQSLKLALEVRINELSQLIRQASAALSRFTKYTSLTITPQIRKSSLKAVQVVPIEPGKALAIVVTNSGLVRNNMVRISDTIQPDWLIKISNILNEKLSGKTVQEVDASICNQLEIEQGIPAELLLPIIDGIINCIDQGEDSEVYLEGTTNIFNHPEFMDIMKAKEFLSLLDEKRVIHRLVKIMDMKETDGINIQIGAENGMDEVKDCSLITTTYSIGNTPIASVGIIGPTRMEYAKVISSMSFIRKMINREIRRMLGTTDDA